MEWTIGYNSTVNAFRSLKKTPNGVIREKMATIEHMGCYA